MSAAHTPGPLRLGRRGLSPAVIDSKGRLLAECPYHDSHAANYALIEEAIANAQLYAAAPDLLTCLQDAVNSFADSLEGGEADEWVIHSRAAIAKATGATP